MDVIFDVTLPIELSNGNTGRGHAFWSSANRRTEYEATIKAAGIRREPFTHPVHLTLVRILGKRQRLWDYDSVLRGSAKELIDAMVAAGWFIDDGPEYITGCVGEQDRSSRDHGPAVRVIVRDASECLDRDGER